MTWRVTYLRDWWTVCLFVALSDVERGWSFGRMDVRSLSDAPSKCRSWRNSNDRYFVYWPWRYSHNVASYGRFAVRVVIRVVNWSEAALKQSEEKILYAVSKHIEFLVDLIRPTKELFISSSGNSSDLEPWSIKTSGALPAAFLNSDRSAKIYNKRKVTPTLKAGGVIWGLV